MMDFVPVGKAVCFPGGIGCVLKEKFGYIFRVKEDPLVKIRRLKLYKHLDGFDKLK